MAAYYGSTGIVEGPVEQGGYQDLPPGGVFVDGWYYFARPKADGGWDFYKATNRDITSMSYADWTREGGQFNEDWKAGTPEANTSGGPTVAQLKQALQNYQNDLKSIDTAYQQGLLTWQEKADAIQGARNTALQQRDTNTEQNNAYFQYVSPDAIQSQQGTYQNKIFDSFKQNLEAQDRNQARLNMAQQQWGQSLNQAKTQAQQAYEANVGGYQSGTSQMAAMPNFQNEVAQKIASGAILPQNQGGGQLPLYASTTNKEYENWLKKQAPINQYLG